MAATSLKLPDALKKRISRLVAGSDRTAHAFMVEAIERAAQREELRQRFGQEAAESEQEALQTRQLYDASEVFDYLEASASGTRTRRPKAKKWPKSS